MSADLEQLEASIDAAVDDAARYAVLGDWYAQHGHPRGELIALQLDGGKKTRARREREEALLLTRGLRIAQPQRAQWRWGFVHTLLFELVHFREWEAHLEDWPEALLQPQLAHPSCRFLRELVLDASPSAPGLDFLAARLPRHVRALTLDCNELDLGRVRAALLGLEKLHLRAQLVTVAPLTLPALEDLSLPLDAVRGGALGLVVPRLRRLTLTSLEVIDRAALAPLLDLAPLDALTLVADRTGRSAVDALLDSPLVASLTTLDVSRSGLTEEGAQRLLARVPEFAHLSSLVLGDAVE